MRQGQDSFLLPRAPDTDSYAFLCSGAGIALRVIRTKAEKLGVLLELSRVMQRSICCAGWSSGFRSLSTGYRAGRLDSARA